MKKREQRSRENMELLRVVSCAAAEAVSRSMAAAQQLKHPTDGKRLMLEKRVVHLR
jgi:hypothetical protein